MLLPFKSAAPFWSSILFAVSLWFSFFLQGWAILFVPVLTLLILPLIDQYVGLQVENLKPDIEESRLFWYRLINLIWAPIQFITLFGILAYNKNSNIKFLFVYLIFISIILELLHIFIPVRAFQIADLFGNFIGVILILSIYFIKNEFF